MFKDLGIITAVLQQLFVSTPLADGSVFKHEDLICVLDGRDPVSDDKDRMVIAKGLQLLLDIGFRLHIHRGRGVVQNQDRRILDQRPRQRNPLFLPAGKSDAPLADDGIIAVRKLSASAITEAFFTVSTEQSGLP